MKANFLKLTFFMATSALILTSCVNDDDYGVPTLECIDQSITTTKTVQEIYNQASSSATLYTGEDIIEAIVVSSDMGGNFYKSLYLTSVDGSLGFNLQVNQVDLFTDYNVGRKVYIKLDGLYTQIRSNTLQIGALFNNNVGQIPTLTFRNNIIRSCDITPEEDLVQRISLSQVNDSYIGKLVELQNVQFTDASLNQTYFNTGNVDAGGQTLTYITDSENETIQVPFRTGSFADYAGTTVSSNSGTIRGILTKFNSIYQFVSRYETDINLTEERIGGAPAEPGEGESEFAVGGTDIVFAGSLTENFESYALAQSNFPKYVNDHTEGQRYWQIKQFPASTGNKYIEMTAFNGNEIPGQASKSYFFVPVDFGAANSFTFNKEIRFMAGEALKVYYITSANYTALNTFNPANLVNITSSFTGLVYPATGQSQNTFTTAGTYTIPSSLTGTGFFVFEYTGTSTITTTIQIDDITIN
ncbi:MAG: hypothetical protein EOO92_19605 [Pedobacter sp.]|nr:MAG: hypothetical protein EOO92_19605 [Pedobacter sp.]